MAEFRSALATRLTPGRFGAEIASPPIGISEQPLGVCFQIVGWPGTFDEALRPVFSALGISGLGHVGRILEAGEHSAFRTAPERVLLRTTGPGAWETAIDVADSEALTLLDLSHARSVIRLAGSMAPELLARIVSIDLDSDAFQENAFSLTGIQAVPVMLHRLPDVAATPRYELYVPYTWAASIWDLLCLCALPFGYEIGVHRS